MNTYHEYVIHNGEFIGKFEEMYQRFEDPWKQSHQPNPYGRQCAILNLKRFGIQSLIEFGCGLGYYSNWIHQETGIVPIGYDISETAISKARQQFPQLDFRTGDIVQVLQEPLPVDAILLAEIGWYILQDLDEIIELLYKNYAGKYLINNQVFYKGTQQFGRDYFTTLQEYINYMPFKLIGYTEATTVEDSTIDTSTLFKIEIK
ncbi:nodulation protein S NodS [Siphonobacter sp. BAB-5385]|uniref:class I SAM-dependent methyltransferase n=1 Tax=unclassified Siphonobacter TaxID=2635712 RepID=UPI000B9E7BEF|nr:MULTISPECIES: class I SAM-dependent methyltransferase [unclassified Siphonobacter]OZI05327.1 nodulation protein S NodS [Siphonobacter sp. BAB-5385]PMD98606.1 nodulation protein S NodS [Siphonobacter sp. BAB-5405]